MINVLLVEDEWLMMVGLKSMIDWEEFGFRIVGEASNGKEALEIMRKTPVDLLITDIKMPVMNGIELIKETEKTFDQCEYLILSCLDEFSYVKDALKLGVSDYLIKSDINKDRLIEVLDTVKKKIEEGRKQRYEHMKLVGDYKKSLGYFKQALFKEVISGLKRSEELQSQKDALKICLESAPLIVLKIMLDDFQQLRKKYVEKDEMLLRFSIMNILQEIIPGENKEIVVENSAEYVAAVNVEGDEDAVRLYAHQLCRRIMNTLKDFMNISVSIGVSRLPRDLKRSKTHMMKRIPRRVNVFSEAAAK